MCTLGPSTDSNAVLDGLIAQGMDGARVNLSFGDPEESLERIRQVRGAADRAGRNVAIIADLPGRKVRIGRLKDHHTRLDAGEQVILRMDDPGTGDATSLPIEGSRFCQYITQGDAILLSGGLVELRVTDIQASEIRAEVICGGEVVERTGVHTPGLPLKDGPLTEADLQFLKLAIDADVDYVALTYVRDSEDIVFVKEKLADLGKRLPVIAKIERSEAFARLDGILRRADAVMVRRGDLGAEIEMTRIPLVQKEILRLANHRGVPVIIATQMLGSMIAAPGPTRAEASDVSNAILDGADCVLLSAETAIGKYPEEATRMMARIIIETERSGGRSPGPRVVTPESEFSRFPDTTASIACRAASECDAKLIACFTESGRSARLVAKYRPHVPIVAFSESLRTRRLLALNWGVASLELDAVEESEMMVKKVDARLLQEGLVRKGDRVVIVFGAPVGEMGHTNSVRLHEVGSAD